MFSSSPKRPDHSQAIHTLLGKGTLWKGEIHAGQNSLRIEGTVEGNIQSEGEVTIAPSGDVKGTIEAKHLIVTGRIRGTFKIMECLEIHDTGYVEGDVEVGSLVVDEGGTLQGSCTRRGVEKTVEAVDKDAAFVPFPTPPAVPVATMASTAFTAASAAGRVPDTRSESRATDARGTEPRVPDSRSTDEAATDRHVFNIANGVSPLPPAGEHAYSKTKL